MVQGFPQIPETFNNLIPRNMDWWEDRWGELLVETVQMGFAATGLSLIFAIPTALLAARNVAPARWIYNAARSFILGVRALPDLIVAVIFVAALGLGPQPGVLALAIGLYGFSTKLFADSIEEIKEGPRDGVRATGASGLQETFTSVLPQAMPAIIGHSLYVLDVSLRASTVLGIVGAGGIGFPLVQGTRLFQFELVGGLLICIFALVYAIEILAAWVRKQVI
jgi:phosphonate transport system permease protein